MKRYYLNKMHEFNGKKEVHREDCHWMDFVQFKIDLGLHPHSESALQLAKTKFPPASECKFCCKKVSELVH